MYGGNIKATNEEEETFKYIPVDSMEIIPNATKYQPDDICELIILAPFSPANGLLVLDCDGQVSQPIRFQIEPERDSTVVEFKILKDWIPNCTVHVELMGTVAREMELTGSSHRPAMAACSIILEVSSDINKLDVSMNIKETSIMYTPSSTIHIDIDVKQLIDSMPARQVEVCLFTVDEAILSLTDYKLQSLLNIFYSDRSENIRQYQSRTQCFLFNQQHIEQVKREIKASLSFDGDGCGGGGGGGGEDGWCRRFKSGNRHADQRLAVRSNFNPLACWAPSLVTDSAGHVTVEVQLPDNVTRYRVWAVAANDKQYGLGEMSFTVELPIMIRPSLPRFLNYGDMAYVSVILQNQTDLSLLLHTGLRTTNTKLLTAPNNLSVVGYSIVLSPHKRTALTFPITTIHSGRARFQFVISTPKNTIDLAFGDAIELNIPVLTPGTSEAFTVYDDLCEEVVVQPVKMPKNVLSQFGELSITTSSTALASLTDAIISLYTYPYECTEQLSSRLLGIQSLWDVLQAFNCKELSDVSKLKNKLESDLNVLKGRQYPNGGFGYWTNQTNSHANPFMSIHVAHCLAVIMNKKVRIL